MMEEVGDDTNGESTFEFVGGKVDEAARDVAGTVPFAMPPSVPDMTWQPQAPSFVPAIPNEPHIQFYDPAQQDSKFTILPPLVNPEPQLSPEGHLNAVPSNVIPSPPPPPRHVPRAPTQPQSLSPTMHHSLSFPEDVAPVPRGTQEEEMGVWGWFKGKSLLNKVAEKAKSSVDTMITTLDPGMKEIINTGGDVHVVVASGSEAKVSAVREAFQCTFGKATVQGVAAQSSSIAPQPVGFSAGLKAAEERIANLRQQSWVQGHHVLVAIENFLAELTPDNWFDLGCLLLQDGSTGMRLQMYTEAIPIAGEYVAQARERTPPDDPLSWSGFAVPIGEVIGCALGVPHAEWQERLTGVARRERILLAARTLAGLYRAQIKT